MVTGGELCFLFWSDYLRGVTGIEDDTDVCWCDDRRALIRGLGTVGIIMMF